MGYVRSRTLVGWNFQHAMNTVEYLLSDIDPAITGESSEEQHASTMEKLPSRTERDQPVTAEEKRLPAIANQQ
ncbi:hypothetical protein [Glutamicibacter sp.]|uniref:hypothetical protein n=1 Tax=Glutamicibacter sp. TaxID=1931995 RepID=UPI0028BE56FC|nr:hypothetical protein [Glutamicibacter sp.]